MPVLKRAAAATAAAAAMLTAAPAAATSQETLLTCQVATTAERPITFNPPVRFLPHTVTAQAGLALTGCTASSGTGIRSGVMTVRSTGRASCAGVQDIRGKGTITWYGADGRKIGTSTLRPSVEKLTGYNPGDMLLSGRVTKGRLAGSKVTGTATPTSTVSTCATKGLATIHGKGTITFLA
ncbi:hypothetical protein FE391_42810 [Nonomuraea sp. KC401]|uniref:hypothetical protein n=1 Tax=unclassified Nonomuraea TaxID=2593643 RepID=UPI0010FE0AA5|nr:MULTISPECIES: hypothetical protein [unclassified Nonomuraea]NBE97098.1 hypothetical protein [Nonomuraea sp. K271]TLF53554.1 hypothetical protein FE391_42810 [Nonomuraea sp. KC401]